MLRIFRRSALLVLLVIPALAAYGNALTDPNCFTDRDSRRYICVDEQN